MDRTITNTLFKEMIAALTRLSGLPFLIRKLIAANKVTILVYHDPSPSVLEQHISYLTNKFHIIQLDLLLQAIRSNDWSRIPTNALVLTFDDGHANNYGLIGVFRKYNLKPTIYLCTGIIDSYRQFWFKLDIQNKEYIKRIPNLNKNILLSIHHGFRHDEEYPEQARQALNKSELCDMNPLVDFGAHTMYHPVLTNCADWECFEEISTARQHMNKLFGFNCRHFSYPNGDYGDREVQFVQQAGYDSARTTDIGFNDLQSNPFKLKAMVINDSASINILKVQLSGIPAFIKRALKGSFDGKKPRDLS